MSGEMRTEIKGPLVDPNAEAIKMGASGIQQMIRFTASPPKYVTTVDGWLASPSKLKVAEMQKLQMWFKSENLEWGFRGHCAHGQERKYLMKEQVWEMANAWMQRARKQIAALGVSTRKKPIEELTWRLVRERMMESVNAVAKMRGAMAASNAAGNDDSSVRFLPVDIRWAYLHPGLMVDDKDLEDTVVQSGINSYLTSNPPPNVGAVSMFQWARGNFDKFFPHVQKLMADGRKAEKAAELAAIRAAEAAAAAAAREEAETEEEETEEDMALDDLLTALGKDA